jgi:signal transduction histidine kinase
MGITFRDLGRITDRFYRSAVAKKMHTEGLGLSLHASKKIVARHGGKLTFRSKGTNKGAIFTVSIPKH